MRAVKIHDPKTHLSGRVDEAAQSKPLVIAKAGKPMVKAVPLNTPPAGQACRLGFMAGQITVPDDFDTMGRDKIERLFGAE